MDTSTPKYLYIVVVIGLLGRSSAGKNSCIQSSARASHVLKCPYAGDQIVSVNVTAGTQLCTRPECHGDTASLLANAHNCYWKQNCTIDFPEDPIIRVPEGGEQCFGQLPKFMILEQYRCFSPTPDVARDEILLDICRSREVRGDNLHSQGLIRSHDYYPLMYNRGDLSNVYSVYSVCSLKIWGRPRQKLVISVLDLDLGEDDAVELVEKNGVRVRKPIPVTSSKWSSMTSAEFVTINFKISEYSNGGRGFILCFKFIDANDHAIHACDQVTRLGEIFPPEQSTVTIAPVMSSNESPVTNPPSVRETTLKPDCYNKIGKIKKKCRPKKEKRCCKRGGKCDKGKRGRKKRNWNKKRRQMES